jgi:hypothetical protein
MSKTKAEIISSLNSIRETRREIIEGLDVIKGICEFLPALLDDINDVLKDFEDYTREQENLFDEYVAEQKMHYNILSRRHYALMEKLNDN